MENLIIQIFNVLIQSLLDLYIIVVMSKKLSKVEKYKGKQIIFLFLFILLPNSVSLALDYTSFNYLKPLVILVFETIAMIIILKQKISYSILIEVITYIMFMTFEMLYMFFLKLITNKPIHVILGNTFNRFLGILVYDSILFIIIFVINYILNRKNIKSSFLNNISTKHLYFLIIAIIIYILPQSFISVITNYSYPPLFIGVNLVQFILITIFTFYFLRKDMDYQKSREDLITSEIHNKTLIGMIDGVRTLKHDYNNIIQSLNGYVVTKQYDKLENHIKSLLKECNGINNISSIDPKVFNDPAIYGIVGSKYFLANEKGIPFEFDITTDVAGLDFPKPELSRILGILIDNAIEATTKSTNPYIRLQIRFDNRKCADLIKIYNTYDTSIDINLQDIFKKGYSSKEVKSGIGLWEVKKLVKQNPNSQIYASIEENMFVQNIVIER